MLPDYPSLKRRIQKVLQERLRRRSAGGGAAAIMSSARQFEGDSSRIDRADGTVDPMKPVDFTGTFTIPSADVDKLSMGDVVGIVDKQAASVADGKQKIVADALEELSPQMTQVPPGASPFTAEGLLTAIEAMELDFESGRYSLTWVVHPEKAEAVRRAHEEIEASPELRERWAQLMERKREEWRAREAGRVLVG